LAEVEISTVSFCYESLMLLFNIETFLRCVQFSPLSRPWIS